MHTCDNNVSEEHMQLCVQRCSTAALSASYNKLQEGLLLFLLLLVPTALCLLQ
jgi:hypothetical protein